MANSQSGARRINDEDRRIDRHVGARIRARRKMLRISQTALGLALNGLSFQQVQKYEKGVNRVGGSRLFQIATILKVPPSYFYDGLNIADTAEPVYMSAEDIAMLRAFRGISDEAVRKALIATAEAMTTPPVNPR